MNYPEQRTTDSIIAISAALVVHLILFFLLVALFQFEEKQRQTSSQLPSAVEKTYVELSPTLFEKKKKPIGAAVTQEKQRSEEAPEDAKLIGERNTQEASETIIDDGKKDAPTQISRNIREQKVPDTFDSSFVDAPVRKRISQSQPSEEVAAQPKGKIESQKKEADNSLLKNDGEALKNTQTELVQTPRQVEVARQIEKTSKERARKKGEALKELERKGVKEAQLKKKLREKAIARKSFQSERKKTRIIGNITRKGTSALNVKKTALGEYYSVLSRRMERSWQQQCLQYRDHIRPGVITIRFLVNEDGRIHSTRFHDVVSASEIQKGFTLRSVQQTRIPPMPSSVVRELAGEELELIYRFNF